MMARPTKLTPELQAEMVLIIRAGNYQVVACRHVGIPEKTFYEWMRRGERGWKIDEPFREFRAEILKARATAEIESVASSFEGVAANADEFDDIGDFIKATAKASRKALGDRIEVWKPILDKVGANLSEKAETGAMTTPEECRIEWLKVAAGLRSCL